ncbi:MAG: PQQ-dependent sugar dehydrogenase, partial [Dehalococcoidia bacterium]
MRRLRFIAVLVAIFALSLTAPVGAAAMPAGVEGDSSPAAPAALGAGQLDLRTVTGGLTQPLGVTHAGDGSGRLFITQQNGIVRVVKNGALATGTFIDVRFAPGGFTTGGERGLLGLAFHPGFETNRKLFVYYTDGGGDLVIAEMTATAAGTSAPTSTLDRLLTIEHGTYSNHNGGQLLFGPDGYLYVFTGDGGGGGDPLGSGQNINTLLGKVLRIAPNLAGGYTNPPDNPFVGAAGLDEIWAYGMRNPWRASFDRANGNLWIADVGQGNWEEINRQPGTADGVNYGWRCREGKHWFNQTGCGAASLYTDPIAEYGHAGGNCSVTGGNVYRGTEEPDLVGHYVLADYCSGRIWTISAGGSALTLHRDTTLNISSFGESESGEVYAVDLTRGTLYLVVAPPFSDITNSQFYYDIKWAASTGVTSGCGGSRFCPDQAVTREQMASFLARALNLPAPSIDFF